MEKWIKKQLFVFHCKKILKTQPIKPKENGTIIISMLHHADVLMYLIAI